MRAKFRLQLDVVLDTDGAENVIEAARRCCAAEGTLKTVDEHGATEALPVEEFIGGIEDALMELLERNPLLANANVEVEGVACRTALASPEPGPFGEAGVEPSEVNITADELVENETADDIEDFETGLYLCRWPNGDFSLVKADDRTDAVVQLDEWAGAEPDWLVPLDRCMIDFRLNERGEIELAEFGEETGGFIWEKCYSELDQVLSSEDVLRHLNGERKREAANKIRRAVEHERKRLWHVQREGTPAKTAMGRELQKRLGTVGPVADRYVEIAANEILRTKGGEKGKPN